MTKRGDSGKDQDQQAREAAELRARLARLSDALDAQARQEEASRPRPSRDSNSGALSLGFRVLSEFVAAVLVGTFIGWQIDAWVGTSPGFLLLFICLGTAAGFWNVYRMAAGPRR